MATKKVVDKHCADEEEHLYECFRCGVKYEAPVGHFYKSQYSTMYLHNDKYVPLCKKCINELFESYTAKYRSEKIACISLCYMMDLPFYNSLYESITSKNAKFTMGMYCRQMNNKQYRNTTFQTSILCGEIGKSNKEIEDEKEDKWKSTDKKNADEAISIIGYDPFDGYKSEDRKFLFNELIKYFDDDIADDTYKLSQIIQIVNNNNQIRKCDVIISSLNPAADATEIKELNNIKKDLVINNDKIAKENEISVKNRSNKDIGKSTLTYHMKEMRELNIKNAEANYYDQVGSIGAQWAADKSLQAIKENTFFDDNDKADIFQMQRELIQNQEKEIDELKEKNRLLLIATEEKDGENNEKK